MGRAKKNDEDEELNRRIGARLTGYRANRGWSLAQLADRLGVSVAHVSALEAGKHAFSASQLKKLATIFGESANALLGADPPSSSLVGEWGDLFEKLPARDRMVLLDLARRLQSWSDTFLHRPKRDPRKNASLISLEGIDGVLLRDVAEYAVGKLSKHRPAVYCPYVHEHGLWPYMIRRFAEATTGGAHAVERTLLFACERLHRQETRIKPALEEEATVITEFFAMAPAVYQSVEGVGDRRVIDILGALLLPCDRVIVIQSDANVAKDHAVPHNPTDRGTFYSPYRRVEEFEEAKKHYAKAIEEFSGRGHDVREIKTEKRSLDKELKAQVDAAIFSPPEEGTAQVVIPSARQSASRSPN